MTTPQQITSKSLALILALVGVSGCVNRTNNNTGDESKPTEGGMTSGGYAETHNLEIAACEIQVVKPITQDDLTLRKAFLYETWIGARHDIVDHKIEIGTDTTKTDTLFFNRDGFNLNGKPMIATPSTNAGMGAPGQAWIQTTSPNTYSGMIKWKRDHNQSETEIKLTCRYTPPPTPAPKIIPKKIFCDEVLQDGSKPAERIVAVALANASQLYAVEIKKMHAQGDPTTLAIYKDIDPILPMAHTRGIDLRVPEYVIRHDTGNASNAHLTLQVWKFVGARSSYGELTFKPDGNVPLQRSRLECVGQF